MGVGIGSMLGAGVFAVWGPVAQLAGRHLLLAVVVAAVIATCNALSTAQAASLHPVAGGAYTFGLREVHPAAGYLAGIGFVVGKTASVASMGLVIGSYVWPGHAPVVACIALALSWLLNAQGITRTAWASAVIGLLVVAFLLAAVGSSLTQPADVTPTAGEDLGWWQVAQNVGAGAALMFFAFAGYARIATFGEEVREPERTVPRAIAIALTSILALYLLVAWALTRRPGLGTLLTSQAPVADLADGVIPRAVVAVVAVIAACGAMVALTAGIGRTAMAMARERDLPRALARRNGKGVPAVAEGVSCVLAMGLAWIGDLTFVLSMSSFAVLVYYAVANLSALRARRAGRHGPFTAPRWVPWLGLIGCVAAATCLPVLPVLAAIGLGLVAFAARWLAAWWERTRAALEAAKRR